MVEEVVEAPDSEKSAKPQKSGVVRLLGMVAIAVVGVVVVWEATMYGCYAMSLSRLRTAMEELPVDDIKRLNVFDVLDSDYYVVGAPTMQQNALELGKTQALTYEWPGLLMTYGTINLVYDQEDRYQRITEIRTGRIELKN